MLNLAQFWTPSHFEREYLRNGWRYPKSVNLVHYSVNSLLRSTKNVRSTLFR